MKILNIAAGKQKPLYLPGDVKISGSHRIVNIDTSYFIDAQPSTIEVEIEDNIPLSENGKNWYCHYDVVKFMEQTKIMFDRVVIYRFLEHVTFTQVPYFIYLVSTIIKSGGIVDIIVPDYSILAKMILNENPFSTRENFEASNILLTTELVNEPSCPHASIWTDLRAKYFWELEGRFDVQAEDIFRGFQFDGRDIYLRFFARRK